MSYAAIDYMENTERNSLNNIEIKARRDVFLAVVVEVKIIFSCHIVVMILVLIEELSSLPKEHNTITIILAVLLLAEIITSAL